MNIFEKIKEFFTGKTVPVRVEKIESEFKEETVEKKKTTKKVAKKATETLRKENAEKLAQKNQEIESKDKNINELQDRIKTKDKENLK